MTRFRAFSAVAALMLLAACGSSPQHNFYLLSAESRGGATGQSPSLGIGPIEIPEYLNRSSLVFSRGSNQLHIASFERWAEPLDDGIQRVLGLNLAAQLGTQNIRPYPWQRTDAPTYAVQLWLLSLDAADQAAELVVEWRVTRAGHSGALERRISRLSQTLPGPEWQAADAALAYSKLLQALSTEIAAVIRDSETAAGS